MRRRGWITAIALAVCAMLLSMGAFADDVSYIKYEYTYSESGGSYLMGEKAFLSDDEYTIVDSDYEYSAPWTGAYVVVGNVEITERIKVSGEADLILTDGCTLTASAGISVTKDNTLNIYGQSEGDGALTATGVTASGTKGAAGIGGEYAADEASLCGTINIHGGVITALGENTYSLIHFKNLHREYSVATEEELNALVSASELEDITVEPTEDGIRFTLPGNLAKGSFSPFALRWEEKQPGLSVSKSADTASAGVGETINYTIVVENTGNTALENVVITDSFTGNGELEFTLPEGVVDNGGGTFTIAELAVDGIVTITAEYTVVEADAGTTLSNTVAAESGETEGGDGAEVEVPEAEEPDDDDDDDDPWWPPYIPPVDEPDDTVPPMLNGEDHFAYVIGYEDGTVKPEGRITRAEVATIIFRLLDSEVRDANLTTGNSFTDVNDGDWYNTAVSTLVKLGIISGRSETEFDPDAQITRAEFATLFARFDESGVTPDYGFSDIGAHWARESIGRAAALGWITGYNDGTFRPDNKITRAEAMTMINRVLNRDPVEDDDLHPDMRTWTDNRPGTWYYFAVQEATNSHEYTRPDAHEDWTAITADPDWTRYQ